MSRHMSIATAIAAVFFVAPLPAQTSAQDTPVSTAVTITAVERLVAPTDSAARVFLLAPATATARFAVRAPATPVVGRTAFVSEGGHSPAMMIVGGSAILVGGLVGGKGGSAIMIGGAVIGLVGLWNYLK